jgi:hypothetical protein
MEQDRQKVIEALQKRYPNQGMQGNISVESELQLFMWMTIIEIAKNGDFDRIRPDILVMHFDQLKNIRDDYCN